MALPEYTPPCESPELDTRCCPLQRTREGLTGFAISFLLISILSPLSPPSSEHRPTSLVVGELWQCWVIRDALVEPESDFISTWSRRRDWGNGLDWKPRTSWQDVAFQGVKRWISSFVSFLMLFGEELRQNMGVGGQTSKRSVLSFSNGSGHTSCESSDRCRTSFIQGLVAEWTKDRDNDQNPHLSAVISKHRCALSIQRAGVTWIFGALGKRLSQNYFYFSFRYFKFITFLLAGIHHVCASKFKYSFGILFWDILFLKYTLKFLTADTKNYAMVSSTEVDRLPG